MNEAYGGFNGTVRRTVAGSTPDWPERPDARGKPNVVVVLADDLGFADLGCFGSEIATPHLDALAARGLQYTNFHVTPMCSPTRAALLTGLNPHLAGVGHVAHSDPGFPGYAMELADNAVTLAEVLRGHGYATLMVGKWHLAKDSDCRDAGLRHSWPCQRGFDWQSPETVETTSRTEPCTPRCTRRPRTSPGTTVATQSGGTPYGSNGSHDRSSSASSRRAPPCHPATASAATRCSPGTR